LLSTTFDVVVDFSKPEVALENLKFYAENDIKVVMATTGWYKNLEDVKLWFKNSK
jgi:dihydrodipicolinate reductase